MYHPRLKGDHYEMGLHYGELLYKAGETLSDVIKLTEKQKDFAFASLPVYEKYLPNIMEEVKGLAHGLKQKYEDVACWLISLYCFESTHGCSVFAVKENDHVYFARNMDMFPEFKKTSESVLYMPQDKNAFIAHSTSMIAVEDGLNEHGLAVALTFLLPKSIKQGINGGFIVRYILEECKTAKEAADFLRTLPISSAHNIVVADKSGDMFVAECTAEQLHIRYCEKCAVATNHFISSEMERYNNEEINWYRTADRFQTLETFLNCNEVDFAISRELIAGKYGFTCQYEKKLHFDTIWSVVYDLSDLYNEICEGNPSKSKFKYDNRLAWGLKKKYGTDTRCKE